MPFDKLRANGEYFYFAIIPAVILSNAKDPVMTRSFALLRMTILLDGEWR